MLNFPYPLTFGFMTYLNRSALGFNHATGFVINARRTPVFDKVVDPMEAYGLTPEQADELNRLNRVVGEVTQVAMDAAQAALLKAVPTADAGAVELVLGSRDCFDRWSPAVGAAIAMLSPAAESPAAAT